MQLYYCCLVAVIFSIIYYGSADIQIYNLKTSQNLKSHYFFLSLKQVLWTLETEIGSYLNIHTLSKLWSVT